MDRPESEVLAKDGLSGNRILHTMQTRLMVKGPQFRNHDSKSGSQEVTTVPDASKIRLATEVHVDFLAAISAATPIRWARLESETTRIASRMAASSRGSTTIAASPSNSPAPP